MNDELKVMIGNLFSNLPDQIDKESFETIISSESLRIERIISKDHRSPEDYWYDPDTNASFVYFFCSPT